VPIGYQDGRSVSVTPSVATGSVDQLFDLALGQIFARPGRAFNCYTY
jgi:hypothetical protein